MSIEIDATVEKVREALDEEVYVNDLAVYPEDFNTPIYSDFSTDDLRNRVVDGARYIAARVRAQHQPDNVRAVDSNTAGEIDLTNDRILDDPNGDDLTPMIRLLEDRVEVGGTDAQRRTLLKNMYLESTGREATSSYPVFVYEDFEFIVEQGSGSGDATADVVDLIFPTDGAGGEASFDGVSFTWNENGKSKVPLPSFLENALVLYVVHSCFVSLRKPDLAQRTKQKMLNEMVSYSLNRSFPSSDE